uniref:THO complex subunit 7 homolog n=1 Tax=Nannospalax galili TaxID=1026970 RepID=A0A8C6W2D4_NANGA
STLSQLYDLNLREMENYEKIYKEIECSTAGAHEKLLSCKKQVLQANQIWKNRQEYDALHHPDRHETLKELEALGKELKLELRRKQFHALFSTIHELNKHLNDEKLTEAEDAQTTIMEAGPKMANSWPFPRVLTLMI